MSGHRLFVILPSGKRRFTQMIFDDICKYQITLPMPFDDGLCMDRFLLFFDNLSRVQLSTGHVHFLCTLVDDSGRNKTREDGIAAQEPMIFRELCNNFNKNKNTYLATNQVTINKRTN